MNPVTWFVVKRNFPDIQQLSCTWRGTCSQMLSGNLNLALLFKNVFFLKLICFSNRCDVCGYMVTRPRFLESHKLTHLPEEEKPFHCEHCPRSFCWKGALQIHMISHQPADKRRLYICHVCGKS